MLTTNVELIDENLRKLGTAFLVSCPNSSDCRAYLHFFINRETCLQQLDNVTGYPQETLMKEIERLRRELINFYYMSHQVKSERRKLHMSELSDTGRL